MVKADQQACRVTDVISAHILDSKCLSAAHNSKILAATTCFNRSENQSYGIFKHFFFARQEKKSCSVFKPKRPMQSLTNFRRHLLDFDSPECPSFVRPNVPRYYANFYDWQKIVFP